MDGVLAVSWQPLPGAAECLQWLRERGIDTCLVTNTSSRSRREMARILEDGGMPVDPTGILTAVSSAARFLRLNFPDAACVVVNDGPIGEDLADVVVTEDPEAAGVVLLGGAGPAVGYDELNSVFNLALDGVPVVALHRNSRYQTAHGPALDMGAFIVGLEAAAGIEIPVLGKPSPEFFRAALAAIGTDPGETIMVGDDIDSDVRGAQAVGIAGVLVRTGKFRADDLRDGGVPPDHVIDAIGDLPALIEHLSRSGDG